MALEENTHSYGQPQGPGGGNYKMAGGQPDVIGWNVADDSGKKIGEVQELLFSPEGQVRYLVVSTVDNDAGANPPRAVLIPIGLAELHELHNEVIVPGLLPAQLSALPEYEKGNITPVMEAQTRSILLGHAAGDAIAHTGDDFYAHEHFSDKRFYNGRMANVPVNDLQMDYGDPGEVKSYPLASPANSEGIFRDPDEAGLDISKYTGPDSKASSQLAGDPTFDQGTVHQQATVHDDFMYHEDEALINTHKLKNEQEGDRGE
jgi:hypothetical protein